MTDTIAHNCFAESERSHGYDVVRPSLADFGDEKARAWHASLCVLLRLPG